MSDASYNSASRELVISRSQNDLPIIAIPPLTTFSSLTLSKSEWSSTYPGGGSSRLSRPPPTPNTAPRSSTLKQWLIAVIVALVIIVAVLGGVLGSRAGSSNGSSAGATGNTSNNGSGTSVDQGEPTSFPTPFDPPPGDSGMGTRTTQAGSTPTVKSTSVCHGRVCTSLLSVVQFSDPPMAFIFGRGKDSAIWYRQTDGDKWLSDWESLGGDMKSQPMAASLEDGQMHVFAYARNYTIRYRQYADGKWNDDDWLEVGKAASSAPYVKACGSEELDVAVIGTSNELERTYYHTFSGSWASWENHDAGWASDAVIGCAPGPYRLAGLRFEGAVQPLFTRTWSGNWEGWVKVGGDFRGNLAITSRNNEESLTFGTTSNLTMSYHNWTRKGQDQAQLIDLKGSFQSVPVLVVMSVDRLDVLAVGTDDRLKHLALIGQTWAPDWQDLGGAFNSTPAAVSLGKDKVSVYGLGVNGSMFHGTWKVSEGYAWIGDGDWHSDGKYLTLEAYRE